MKLAILSPHRDDAAFSSGLLLAACASTGTHLTILNVFTRSGYAPYLPGRTIEAITLARRHEDEALLDLLRSRYPNDLASHPARISSHDLELSDAPLRLHISADRTLNSLSPSDFLRETENLTQHLPNLSVYDLVFAPLALGGHIDHQIVREATRLSVPSHRLGFYEDLPYVSRMTLSQRARETRIVLGELARTDLRPCLFSLGSAAEHKRTLANLYPSQITEEVADEIAAYATTIGGAEQLYLPASAIETLAAELPIGQLLIHRPPTDELLLNEFQGETFVSVEIAR